MNGDRVATLEVTPKMSEADKNGLTLETPPIHVNAGPQRISAAFLQRFAGPIDDLLAPIDHTLADSRIGTGFGITALPHLQDMTIVGPMAVTGVSDTPSRRKIFSCHPTSGSDEAACATEIIKRLTTQAYRGPASGTDIELLTKLYRQGRKDGDFEGGIRLAVQGILANPRFLFRVEHAPATLRAGQIYPLERSRSRRRGCRSSCGTRCPDATLVKAATRHARARRPSSRSRSAACSPIPRRGAGDALRLAVAAAAGRRQDPARRAAVPLLGSSRCRMPSSARPSSSSTASSATIAACSICFTADYIVRQRAARTPLRHAERDRRRVPPRAAARKPPRHLEPGQHPAC